MWNSNMFAESLQRAKMSIHQVDLNNAMSFEHLFLFSVSEKVESSERGQTQRSHPGKWNALFRLWAHEGEPLPARERALRTRVSFFFVFFYLITYMYMVNEFFRFDLIFVCVQTGRSRYRNRRSRKSWSRSCRASPTCTSTASSTVISSRRTCSATGQKWSSSVISGWPERSGRGRLLPTTSPPDGTVKRPAKSI